VEDNCRGVLAALERGRVGEVYNIGSLDIQENLATAQRLLRLMGKPETLISHVKDRRGHDRRYALDCRKMQEDLAWRPVISFEEGLRQTIEWYKSHPGWMADVRSGEYRFYFEKRYANRNPLLDAIVFTQT
jgi:dTDP-glucose 4,6-dehydratase